VSNSLQTTTVTLPSNVCTSSARIKVEAADNVFFAISSSDFVIDDGSSVGQPNNALVLDGSQPVNLGSTLGNFGSGDFTIEYWIKASGFSTAANSFILGKREVCSFGSFWNMYVTTAGKLGWEGLDSGASSYLNSTTTIADNNWYHVAITRSTGLISMYINGGLEATISIITTAAFTNTADLLIGDNPCTQFGAPVAGGLLDEIRIWSSARTSMQLIDSLSCTLAGTETDLSAYYNCDQGPSAGDCTSCSSSSPMLMDLTSNAYHATTTSVFVLSKADIVDCSPSCPDGLISIVTHPDSIEPSVGSDVTLSTSATGTNISYQWQVSTNHGSSFERIEGEYTNALLLSSVTAALDSLEYRCIIRNDCDVDTTDIALLTFVCGGPPAQPNTIQGVTDPCPLQTVGYSIPVVPGATHCHQDGQQRHLLPTSYSSTL